MPDVPRRRPRSFPRASVWSFWRRVALRISGRFCGGWPSRGYFFTLAVVMTYQGAPAALAALPHRVQVLF